MMNKKTDLSITCYGKVKDVDYDIIVLPWGATEPHNYHLPYLTDAILAHDVSVEAAGMAFEKYGVHCMVLPPVTLGSQNPGQYDLKFCIHSRSETRKLILEDIVISLRRQGFCRLVIVNGHGGNEFKTMIRDMAAAYPDFIIAFSNWFSVVPAKDFFEEPGDHADELETSVMMYYHPEWVDLEKAGDGKANPFAVRSLREKVAWLPRDWRKTTQDTGVGNPSKSTAEKGKKCAHAVAEKYAELFFELSRKEIY